MSHKLKIYLTADHVQVKLGLLILIKVHQKSSFKALLTRDRKTIFQTIWAVTRENLSLGFPTKRDSNQSDQLQRLARNLKIYLWQV